MADSSININLEGGQAANETLKIGNNKVTIAGQTLTANSFSPLCAINPDLASNYLTEFINSLTETYTFSEKINTALAQYISSINSEEDKEPDPGTDSGSNPSYGGGGSGSSGSNNSGNSDSNNEDNNLIPIVPPVNEGTQINNDMVKSIEDLDIKDLDGVVDSLIDMAKEKGKGIDEILNDETTSEELKKLLLSSPYITDELKSLLNTLDSGAIRQTMLSIMKGEKTEAFELNALNVGIVYAYLMQIAGENGITVEQLLLDSQYTEILKTTLGEFSDVVDIIKQWDELPATEYQEQLLKIYDGDGINDLKPGAVNIIRTFSEYISDATEIACEELLTNTNYAEVLKSATQQFGKTAIYMNAASNFSTEGMAETINGILTGKNPEALGMTNEEIIGFKAEVDSLAQEKGIPTEELLNSSSYADDVRKVLENSNNAEDIGIIYQKSEATVAQKVVKNLYSFEMKESSNITSVQNQTTISTENTITTV